MRYHWKKLLVALCLVAAATLPSLDHQPHFCFPENDLYIPANSKSITAMDEAKFNHVIDVVEEIYRPLVKDKGGDLKIVRKWEDGTVNAYAQRQGSTYLVSMFGGLARHETVTPEGFAMVVCHEIGHHIGGAPKKTSWFGSSWASNEGQADYWGSTKCMKRVLQVLEEDESAEETPDERFSRLECERRFDHQEDITICKRSSMAGMSLANLFRALRRQEKQLHFWTRDNSVVTTTNHNHPAPQCRLDTYFAGSLCGKSVDDMVSDDDEAKGVCYRKDGFKLEARPLCWFKPKE